MTRGSWALTAAAALLFVACRPKRPATAFVVNDWRICKALQDAAQDWADNGVSIASDVIVQWTGPNAHGVPVRFVSAERLYRLCEDRNRQGCVSYTTSGEDFAGLWVLEGLDDERLAQVVKHELMHVLVPRMPHLPQGVEGVMNTAANSTDITTADLDHVCQYTDCENLAGKPM